MNSVHNAWKIIEALGHFREISTFPLWVDWVKTEHRSRTRAGRWLRLHSPFQGGALWGFHMEAWCDPWTFSSSLVLNFITTIFSDFLLWSLVLSFLIPYIIQLQNSANVVGGTYHCTNSNAAFILFQSTTSPSNL